MSSHNESPLALVSRGLGFCRLRRKLNRKLWRLRAWDTALSTSLRLGLRKRFERTQSENSGESLVTCSAATNQSARGLAQSKSFAEFSRQLLECGSPLPLFTDFLRTENKDGLE